MEEMQDIVQLIGDAKNICIIPQQSTGESVPNALAFFYTLKELGKNVNLIIENVPDAFNFLIPSLDFISTPKNFVISVPRSVAEVSQVYYEKNEENLKIHLTVDKGNLKKDHIAFYFQEAKPDLIITLGIQDFQKELQGQLDSFGFLLDTPILNIDNSPKNSEFGKINIVKQTSLSQITLDIITALDENLIKKQAANCLLTGLILHYDNFAHLNTGPEIFEITADLMKKGAERHKIVEHLYKKSKEAQVIMLKEDVLS